MGAKVFLACAFVVLHTVSAERKCDNLGVLVYDDMNCKPTLGSDGCPTNYDCPDIRKSNDTCYYRGSSLKRGEHANSSSLFCDIGCICNGGPDMEFRCAILECAQYGPPLPSNCYWAYTLKACCGSSYCPPPDKPVHTCTFDGVQYKEGERFFPKNSCSMCLCQKGFKGKIEAPFCIKRQCNTQIKFQGQIQNSCAPVYTRDDDLKSGILCCPSYYTCPDGTEIMGGTSTSSDVCRYGDQTLKVGEGFNKVAKHYYARVNVTCTCKVPPLVTCVALK